LVWQTQLVVHSIEGNRATILAVAAFAAFGVFLLHVIPKLTHWGYMLSPFHG
jgi:type IV secretory pathway VirB2 component (pilin)